METSEQTCILCAKTCIDRAELAHKIRGVSLMSIIEDLCVAGISDGICIDDKLHTCEQCVIALLHAQTIIGQVRVALNLNRKPITDTKNHLATNSSEHSHEYLETTLNTTEQSSRTNVTTSSRPLFECEVCSKQYYSSKLMKRHYLAIHEATGVRLFKCPECDRQYTNKAAMQRHVAFVHQQKRRSHNYVCPHCKCTFFHRSKLTSHLSRQCAHSALSTEYLKVEANVADETTELVNTTQAVSASPRDADSGDASESSLRDPEPSSATEKGILKLDPPKADGKKRLKKRLEKHKDRARKKVPALKLRISQFVMGNKEVDSSKEISNSTNTTVEQNFSRETNNIAEQNCPREKSSSPSLLTPMPTQSSTKAKSFCSPMNTCVFCGDSFLKLKQLRTHIDVTHIGM